MWNEKAPFVVHWCDQVVTRCACSLKKRLQPEEKARTKT